MSGIFNMPTDVHTSEPLRESAFNADTVIGTDIPCYTGESGPASVLHTAFESNTI